MAPICAIAVVPLCNDNGPSDGIDFVGRDKSKDICQPGKGFDVAMIHAKPATRGDVVARQPIVLHDGKETKILREDVHIVAGRHRERGLEFAGQVGRSVDRFGF